MVCFQETFLQTSKQANTINKHKMRTYIAYLLLLLLSLSLITAEEQSGNLAPTSYTDTAGASSTSSPSMTTSVGSKTNPGAGNAVHVPEWMLSAVLGIVGIVVVGAIF